MTTMTLSAFADEISPDLGTQIRVLQENDIHHLELRGIAGQSVSDFTLEQARTYAQTLAAAGIAVSSIGSPIGKIGIIEPFAPHLAKLEHTLALARIFEAPYLRCFSFYVPAGEAADFRPQVMQRMRAMLEVAKAYPEVTMLHENEKGIYGDLPERCLDLVTTLDSPQLRLAFDPANFVQCGASVYPEAFDLLSPYVAYVHIKDAHAADGTVTPAGEGDGHVAAVLAALQRSGYAGFLSIEPHLSPFPGFRALEAKSAVHSIADAAATDGTAASRGDGEVLFNLAAAALRGLLAPLDQRWD
ncbi:sugar phosphate isomerase/epimerase family protein [Lacticaseibacillus kribbianus]|uniref:sugar phosphate isomerase/epimerase family protein n=1 Tax=Lacticaseibacillus kribbianus TaxID=2926292 RepID=UPI001CD7CCE3|nr:TIM barrel protein [Lacticaseibacillus kribbianus]